MNSRPARKTTPPSARLKVMDLLARRDHSEKELRTKLRRKEYSEADIDAALAEAKECKWLSPPAETAERYASSLHLKNKGIHYINHHLQTKGLPTISLDPHLELEKALRLVETKFSFMSKPSRDQKAQIARFLTSRGFDGETIRRVVFR